MHDGELWQVFAENGQPVAGCGAIDDDFAHDDSLVMGNAHVWMWRKAARGADILLQKRALTKKTSPGFYHISAAGHINLNESPIEAALRETQEELGLAVDPNRLHLVHVTRTPRHLQSLLYVYTYQLSGDESFSFDDGEVELVEWHDIDHFYEMTKNAASYKLIDQGGPYFDPLIATIKRHAL
jgi:8-oxo-dGTP pyrophosphatase MutT (NUDIX family)